MAKFKVLLNENELIQGLTNVPEYRTVDTFSALCVIKGIDPKKGKPARRTFNTLQGDRISTAYPAKSVVASWFNLSEIPEDYPMSSQESTIAYINRMYDYKAKVVDGRVVY